jgi:hypothetical protein
MTDPIFYSYDNECGFDEHSKFATAERNSNEALNLVDEFTDDVEIHCGIIIPFARMVEKNRRDEPEDEDERAQWERNNWSYAAEYTLENTTPDDVRASIQELDKRGLNTTANDMLKRMLLVIDKLNTDRPNAADFLRANTSESNTAFLDGKESALTFAINEIKKALGVS